MELHGNSVRAFIARAVLNEEDVEELTQNTFIKAYQHLKHYDESKASLSTWLHSIAYHEILMHQRALQQHQMILPFSKGESSEGGREYDDLVSDEHADRLLDDDSDDNLTLLRKAVAQLSDEERQLLHLYYTDGKTHKAIAELTGISAHYIAVKLQRIRKKLVIIIEKYRNGKQ